MIGHGTMDHFSVCLHINPDGIGSFDVGRSLDYNDDIDEWITCDGTVDVEQNIITWSVPKEFIGNPPKGATIQSIYPLTTLRFTDDSGLPQMDLFKDTFLECEDIKRVYYSILRGKMKKTIILIFVLTTLIIPTSFSALAYEENKSMYGPELQIGIFGASIAGLRRTGFVISNTGDQSASEIQWVFTIKIIGNNEIDYRYSDTRATLRRNSAIQFLTNEVNGFGLVTLSLSVSSSNAGDHTLSVKGFQIGPYTISRPWILAWYDT